MIESDNLNKIELLEARLSLIEKQIDIIGRSLEGQSRMNKVVYGYLERQYLNQDNKGEGAS